MRKLNYREFHWTLGISFAIIIIIVFVLTAQFGLNKHVGMGISAVICFVYIVYLIRWYFDKSH